MKRIQKWSALFMAVTLLVTLAAPAALAAENTITIKTAEDLVELSRNCTLDTWSQGKTVILENDVDLRGVDFTPIPIFSGTFQGSGHTISGLTLTGGGNVRGLFRYIQSGATVQNLTVTGTIHPSGRQDSLGLLAGSNAGRLLNCAASGTVMGDNRVGGLLGVNEAGGELVGCSFSGSVTGKHFAGGVVGENYGTLTRCSNSGSINTKDLEDDPKTDYTNLAQINSMENVSAYTDIGGVAGYSKGTVQSCENSGAVGYDQIGYNIGGIAGRSAGWLDGCVNTGSVSGRKDVGGIVGQLEPEVLQTFSEDFLDKLLAQLDTLQNLMDRTANHADSISDSVHAQMDDLSNKVRDTKDIAKELTDAMTDWANGGIDQINELSARISWTLDRLDEIMDDAVDLTDELDRLIDKLDKVWEELSDASGAGANAAGSLKTAMNLLAEANKSLQEAMNAAAEALEAVLKALPNKDSPEGWIELRNALGQLGTALGGFTAAMEKLDKALKALEQPLDDLKRMGLSAQRAFDQLGIVNKAASRVSKKLNDVAVGLNDMIHELSEKPDIKIDPIGPEITVKGDALSDAMDALMDSGDALNALLSDSADTLIADLKAINNQFRSITSLIRSEKADWTRDQNKSKEDQIRDHFQDLSDSCDPAKQHNGRLSASKNEGAVTGNMNLGGIAGSVGIETDFDPEGDLTKVGDYSLDFHYQARALLSDCVNSGAVTGRKDYVGGITGQVYIGQITGCQSYGDVSTDGSYVGGIAGRSDSSIRLSWAKCTLSGEDYVGGIAGYGKTISDCRSLVIVDGGAYTGAIAGDVDKDGSVTGCLFTHETLGAIDGVSYSGKAEPAAFDVLCAGDEVPKAFSQMELTFRADGKVVAAVPFQYGRGIDSLPEIPAKKGCSAVWPELDYTRLTASQTLDAIYTPYSSSLTDDGQALPQILVDGSFSSRAAVSHTSEPVTWTDEKGTARTGTAFTVTVEDPDMTAISYTVHYRLPESGKRYDLWVKTDSGWEKRESTVDGSYLLFTSDQDSVTFRVQARSTGPLLWILLAVLTVLVLVLLAALIRKKRGRQSLRSRLRKTRQKKA